MSAPELILASGSAARREMLKGAGVSFRVEVAPVDEEALKAELGAIEPDHLAVELATAKALAVSRLHPDAWVLGGDQTLAIAERMLDRQRQMALETGCRFEQRIDDIGDPVERPAYFRRQRWRGFQHDRRQFHMTTYDENRRRCVGFLLLGI